MRIMMVDIMRLPETMLEWCSDCGGRGLKGTRPSPKGHFRHSDDKLCPSCNGYGVEPTEDGIDRLERR